MLTVSLLLEWSRLAQAGPGPSRATPILPHISSRGLASSCHPQEIQLYHSACLTHSLIRCEFGAPPPQPELDGNVGVGGRGTTAKSLHKVGKQTQVLRDVSRTHMITSA